MDLTRHNEICRKQKLEVVDTVYEPFKKLRQEKQLPFYYALVSFVNEHSNITDRQFYYHLVEQPQGSKIRLDVSTKSKSIGAYSKVIALTVTCRMGGLIHLESILDDTDLIGTQQCYFPIEEYLNRRIEGYRSDWFENQEKYVECWLEKRALSRIFSPITDEYGVYLSVSGRYPSLAQVKSAIDRFNCYDKQKIILYFGDLDPTGKDMPRYLSETFPKLRCNDVTIEEITINPSDVNQYNLPTIPLKEKDRRTRSYKQNFGIDYGVEIDALSPSNLKQIIRGSIEKHLDLGELEKKKQEDKQVKQETKQMLKTQMQMK